MEEAAMEKTWETFWASGKVTDYLTYRDSVSDGEQRNEERNRDQGQRKQRGNGTVRDFDGDGFDSHAY